MSKDVALQTLPFIVAALVVVLFLILDDPNTNEETVLKALEDRAGEWHYGLELMRDHNFRRGQFYVVLARLEDEGLVETRMDGTGRRLFRVKR